MLIHVDKPFIDQLREAGFDVDYKKLIDIYRQSRDRPAAKARRNQRHQYFDEFLNHFAED